MLSPMGKVLMLRFILSIFSLQLFYISAAHTWLAPALYVFGDSTVDPGNNNNLPTRAKANFLPYGIDFNNTPTGRFTNGMTIADCVGKTLFFHIQLKEVTAFDHFLIYGVCFCCSYASWFTFSPSLYESFRDGEE